MGIFYRGIISWNCFNVFDPLMTSLCTLLVKIHLEKNGTSQELRISQLQRFYLYQTRLSDFLKLVATILLLSKIVNCKK